MGCTILKLRGGIRISYLNARNRPTVSGGGQPPFLRVPMKLPSGSGSKTDYSFESYRNPSTIFNIIMFKQSIDSKRKEGVRIAAALNF